MGRLLRHGHKAKLDRRDGAHRHKAGQDQHQCAHPESEFDDSLALLPVSHQLPPGRKRSRTSRAEACTGIPTGWPSITEIGNWPATSTMTRSASPATWTGTLEPLC